MHRFVDETDDTVSFMLPHSRTIAALRAAGFVVEASPSCGRRRTRRAPTARCPSNSTGPGAGRWRRSGAPASRLRRAQRHADLLRAGGVRRRPRRTTPRFPPGARGRLRGRHLRDLHAGRGAGARVAGGAALRHPAARPGPPGRGARTRDGARGAAVRPGGDGRGARCAARPTSTARPARDASRPCCTWRAPRRSTPASSTLDAWYEAGLRSLGLVWSRPNAFATASRSASPAPPTSVPGLTPRRRAARAPLQRARGDGRPQPPERGGVLGRRAAVERAARRVALGRHALASERAQPDRRAARRDRGRRAASWVSSSTSASCAATARRTSTRRCRRS